MIMSRVIALLLCLQVVNSAVEPGFLDRLLVGNPWHDWYYDMLDWMIRGYELGSANRTINFVEIGVCYGTHVDHLLSHTDNVVVYGVDPYVSFYDPNDFVAVSGDQAHFDKIHDNVMHFLSRWSEVGRYHHKRMRSWDASQDFPENSLDVVFVDGDHRYRAVLTDIEDWWPKLRINGLMLGDDYEFERFGVKQAVDEFAAAHTVDLRFLENKGHTIWYMTKKREIVFDSPNNQDDSNHDGSEL
mmetsp:Transcript_73055/g.171723  ORF Transcript_73055/g.171723 Transcript_73055/m.171723 type:complete len:243 (-) Transcript_73055:20-748(-)